VSALTTRLEGLLDSALSGVQDKLVMREDCQECKASGAGWCPPCLELDGQRESLGLAVARVQRAAGDAAATGIFLGVLGELAGLPEIAPVLVVPGVGR